LVSKVILPLDRTLMNDHPLKILVFMPSSGEAGMDGTTSDAINIAKGFAEASIPSIFIFNGASQVFQTFEATGVDVRRMDMPAPGLKQHFNPVYRRKHSRKLADFIRREKIDVVHLGHGGAFVLNYLKSSDVLKVCVQQGATPEFKPIGLFDSGFTLNPKKLLKYWYRKYVRLNYKSADLVVCIGVAARQAALRTFGVRPERTAIVRPGIGGLLADSKGNVVRTELGIKPDEKVVLSVGRITRAKGAEDLGAVAKILSARGKNYRFVFVGRARDEEYGDRIKDTFGNYVDFLGHRSDIANLYADADMLVHLSHREGSPLVVIEALEFGVPCVAWDLPGVSEDVEIGVTGYAPAFGDHEGAADAIERILESASELDSLSAGARAAFAEFSIDKYAERLLDAYQARIDDLAKS
jgi:glycosyltransferase involved in cell wall biosynthesis